MMQAEDLLKLQRVDLHAPLTTVVSLSEDLPEGLHTLSVSVHIPDDAPTDLMVGAWLTDAHGRWFQSPQPESLPPGGHTLTFQLDAQQMLATAGHAGRWDPLQASLMQHGGVFFFSQETSDSTLIVHSWGYDQAEDVTTVATNRISELSLPLDQMGQWQATTGSRTQLRFLADPLPDNPFDDSAFSAEIHFTHESGSQHVIPAFWKIPTSLRDEGHRERGTPRASGAYYLRFRPRQAGTYQATLKARWGGEDGQSVSIPLPPLQVSGEPWDDYVRVDSQDPRFFSIDGDFFWPIGLNLHSITDVRAQERIGHPGTPMRGSQSYEAYLRRLAAGGGNAAEIWLSNWNLALEWRHDWPFYKGLGRYAQDNAARIDAILDLAHELGIRINLVINNHGQVSERTNREWDDNPYHVNNGGFLTSAADYFTDERAFRYQERYRRYLVARYADHPAILGWKLSSEINLTAGSRGALRTWHEQASAHLASIDDYAHPITTHWSGDYRTPDHAIVQQDGIHYVCINAYQRRRSNRRSGRSVAHHLWLSTQDPNRDRGLGNYGKPVLVTEYGGSHLAGSRQQLLTDHRSGPWAALVAGHGGSPMFWWFEWIDQYDLWRPYQAIAHFIAGEDLRDTRARSARLSVPEDWWAAAWVRPGRILGYVAHNDWAYNGADTQAESVAIRIGEDVTAGVMILQWWCADQGTVLAHERIFHPGGELVITADKLSQHRAFKLWRPSDVGDQSTAQTP